jgi:hypothetical protein
LLLDELRSVGVTTYDDLAATLNRQGIRPDRGRWKAHDLYLLMRRHRRVPPAMDCAECVQGPGERKAKAPEPSSRGEAYASLMV